MNILLFAPSFFGYEQDIARRLTARGDRVTLIPENLDVVSHFCKFLKKRFPERLMPEANRRFQRRIAAEGTDFDLVLVIRGRWMNADTVQAMRNRYGERCRLILYQWDSVTNNPNAPVLAPLFDRVLTSDPEDSRKYRWIYRPMFFNEEYLCAGKPWDERDIDFLLIGSLHSDRARIFSELKDRCERDGASYRAVLVEKRYIYLKRKYLDRQEGYTGMPDGEMTFRPISVRETYRLYARAKTVVDYTHPGQTGITQRTIDGIASGCKVITNNPRIRETSLYDPRRVFIYKDRLDFPADFPDAACEPVREDVLGKYTLQTFLEDILR